MTAPLAQREQEIRGRLEAYLLLAEQAAAQTVPGQYASMALWEQKHAPADVQALLDEVGRRKEPSERWVDEDDCQDCADLENLCAVHDAFQRGWDEAVAYAKDALDNLGDLIPHLRGAER